MSDFIQLQFELASEQVEAVDAALFDIGALAVTQLNAGDSPLFESVKGKGDVWQRVSLQALFDADANLEELISALTQAVGPASNHGWKLTALPDQDWHRAWLDRYEPICFGDRLWVCPSWKPVPEHCNFPIILDPGTAFGTGTHPTTALCLEWLDSFDCADKKVIDFGCGSGILAIAAAVLGATQVVGIDNDMDAVENCRQNCLKNNLSENHVRSFHSNAYPELLLTADLVLANILAGPLIELADEICGLLKPRGRLVLSGILESQIDQVIEAYSGMIRFESPTLREEWVVLTGTK